MSDRLFVATRKGLFTMTQASRGWSIDHVSFLADNCSVVLPDERDATIYAALSHGHFGVKMHRSRDGAKTWQECATPAYPPKPSDYQPKLKPMQGEPAPWNVDLIWALQGGGADQPGVLWCGTIPGGLFRSDDGGDHWQFNRPLWDEPAREEWFGGGFDYPGIHSVCVDPRDSNRVAVGVSCGGVWITADGGQTWRCQADGMRADYMPPESQFKPTIQDPHLLVQCRQAPDAYWVQHHNGIFRSTDAAASWQEITGVKPSAFGFAVAVHPAEPDTAWFVPGISDEKRIPVDGKLVVNRTRDGGKTFEQLTRGLPQNHAYDLTYRHALDVDETGDQLAFGTTTGSLWISQDQGDSWQSVTTHLPPIYCVRFG